jgi:plastocyanin
METYLSLAIVILALAVPVPVFADNAANTVEISGFMYAPDTLTIHAGESVTWVNHDQDPHTIVGKNNEFHSEALDTNDKFTYTFKKPGTYTYFCTLHPQMTGTVTVKP